MKNLLLTALFALLSYHCIEAQPGLKPDQETIAAMQKLHFLLGNWSGEGTMMTPAGKRTVAQKETVISKVNDAVLLVDGLGVDVATNEIAHQAFAVMYYDKEAKLYRIHAFRADGNSVLAEGNFNEQGHFVWGFTHPQAGPVRYTIQSVDGKWIETGESKVGGNNWFQFLEMSLTKEISN